MCTSNDATGTNDSAKSDQPTKVVGSRVVFIVGFERCMTTSLATYLVESGYCSLLVQGIKEPSLFSRDPALARALVERETKARPGTWLLDGSVNYVNSPAALQTIEVPSTSTGSLSAFEIRLIAPHQRTSCTRGDIRCRQPSNMSTA
jgi:hypothetical protein